MKKQKTNPYLLACKKLGITPVAELTDRSDKDMVSADAFYRLTICIRAKNMLPDGTLWKAVYDGSEWHYYPWWKPNPSGPGWSYHGCDIWITRTYAGPRLEYRSLELLKEGVKEFDQYYQDYLG